MYLKRLELQGFKSFADKTVLEFGSGVTTVVGPNGSGKSNISDAVRWVMGEMSAKSLRGANMQDVIFAGTETRKPVNFAEVSLVLDNSTKLFPIEFDEVVVTRRVFRSGESVYQINRANCRLKDIVELFMDTGLGRDGYSMIGQGNVSQILSTKAEDRRSFFEEAAGVSKYKHRKDEAERKLGAVQENLVRINDIIAELESQLRPLENQSKKARKYLLLYEEYKALDVSLSLISMEKNRIQAKKAAEDYASVAAEMDELKQKESGFEEKRSALYDQSKKKDEEQAEKNQALIDNEAESMAAGNDISIAENDMKNNLLLSERIEQEIAAEQESIRENTNKIEKSKQEIAQKETESKELIQKFSSIQEENDENFRRLSDCRNEIDAKKASIIDAMNEISAKKAQIAGMESTRKSFLERRSDLYTEQETHGQDTENTRAKIAETEQEIAEKTEKCRNMQEKTEALTCRSEELSKTLAETNRSLNDARTAYQTKNSQKKMLEGMENDYAGYAGSVKTVLKAPELKRLTIYGTLSGLIDVDKEYIVAIETALGGAMQNIVVGDEEDAKAAIAFLKERRAGRATFLPVSSVRGKLLEQAEEAAKYPGFIGIASELIRYDKRYDGIMKSLLGRVAVVDNIDSGIALSRKFGYRFKTVTLGGEVLNAGGSMSGGSVNRSTGFLSRAGEIKTLTEELHTLTRRIQTLSEKSEETQKDLENQKIRLSSYEPLVREYENEILVLENTKKHLEQALAESGESAQALEQELSMLDQKLSESGEQIAEMISEMRQAENMLEQLNQEVLEQEEAYETLSHKKDLKAKELMDETLRLRTLEKDLETIHTAISEWTNRITASEQTIAVKKEDCRTLTEKNTLLTNSIAEKKAEMERIAQRSKELRTDLETVEQEKAEIVERLKALQNSNKDLTDRLILLQQELSRAEGRQQKLESDLEGIINRLWDQYELTPSAAEETKQEIENEKEARERTQELRGKIKALGSVNLDAIEEYQNVQERYTLQSTQRDDLEKAKVNLEQVIGSMQELMEEHFQKQFEEINKSFSQVFRELFGGGKGRLYLSDPQDVMESGIEIEAQLPGKSTQNISLYSGGEKSFIAIALLFAILEVKPTPFCFLDEIDAALDDVNVSRFATYLKNYLSQTQFIVITHRRGTMEAANIMYGVTMQEKGVSKLLSLHIDDVDDEMLK